jgi:DNA-directed RNA polymerase subunit RPC12/RpoP
MFYIIFDYIIMKIQDIRRIKMTLKEEYQCINCGKVWIARKEHPQCCPKCHSKNIRNGFERFRSILRGEDMPEPSYRKYWGKENYSRMRE